MEENVTTLVESLIDVIERKDWFNANSNQKKLALLDAESADNYIEELEEKLEMVTADFEDKIETLEELLEIKDNTNEKLIEKIEELTFLQLEKDEEKLTYKR